MAWVFTSEAIVVKCAGANANSTITADSTQLEDWSDKVENEICAQARYDCIANYANLTANGKELLGQIEDSMIAQRIISYEPEAIGTIGASLRLNFHQNVISQGMKKIDDGKIKKYLAIPS